MAPESSPTGPPGYLESRGLAHVGALAPQWGWDVPRRRCQFTPLLSADVDPPTLLSYPLPVLLDVALNLYKQTDQWPGPWGHRAGEPSQDFAVPSQALFELP